MSKSPPPESSCPSEEISLSYTYSDEEEQQQQQQLTTAKSVPQSALDTGLDLAKSVWGSKKDTEKADGGAMVKYDLRRRDLKNVGRRDLKREYPFLMVTVAKIEKEIGNSVASMALEMVDPEKASILEKKAKRLRLADVKLNMQELDLQKEILKLVMEDINMTVD